MSVSSEDRFYLSGLRAAVLAIYEGRFDRGATLEVLDKTGRKMLRMVDTELARDEEFLDEASRLTGSAPLACRAGCAFCCMQPVGIGLAELPAIYADVVSAYPGDALTAIKESLRAYWIATSQAPNPTQYRQMCALNRDGLCTIYDGRPISCRSFHSFDAVTCQEFFESQDEHAGVPYSVRRMGIGVAFKLGQQVAFQRRGLAGAVYDLAGCVSHVLDDPESLERLLQGGEEFEPYKIAGSDLSKEALS